jgi:branched-chain amino acid transport system permease protein
LSNGQPSLNSQPSTPHCLLSEFLQQLLNGLSLGAIYALIALGYTMVYGVLRFINFAHSDVFMVGAFIGYYLGKLVPENTVWGGLLVLLVAMLGCAVLGMTIERLAYRPLRGRRHAQRPHHRHRRLPAARIFRPGLLRRHAAHLPRGLPLANFTLGELVISSNQVVVIVVTALLMVGLQFIVYRTKIGTAMRAVSLNPKAAQLVGVNNDVVISFTFGLGSALAGAGGILYALNYPSIDPLMGVMPGLKAFVAAVLGGIGNIPGAALGGLLLGTVETFVNGSQWSTYKDAIAFAILIIILLFRPAGLLGKFTVEKV